MYLFHDCKESCQLINAPVSFLAVINTVQQKDSKQRFLHSSSVDTKVPHCPRKTGHFFSNVAMHPLVTHCLQSSHYFMEPKSCWRWGRYIFNNKLQFHRLTCFIDKGPQKDVCSSSRCVICLSLHFILSLRQAKCSHSGHLFFSRGSNFQTAGAQSWAPGKQYLNPNSNRDFRYKLSQLTQNYLFLSFPDLSKLFATANVKECHGS